LVRTAVETLLSRRLSVSPDASRLTFNERQCQHPLSAIITTYDVDAEAVHSLVQLSNNHCTAFSQKLNITTVIARDVGAGLIAISFYSTLSSSILPFLFLDVCALAAQPSN